MTGARIIFITHRNKYLFISLKLIYNLGVFKFKKMFATYASRYFVTSVTISYERKRVIKFTADPPVKCFSLYTVNFDDICIHIMLLAQIISRLEGSLGSSYNL